MNLKRHRKVRWRDIVIGATLSTLLGLIFWHGRVGERIVLLGYDLLFLMRQSASVPEVAIVYMDDLSYSELRQTENRPWDRHLHAQLVDRLAADQSGVVVFDIVFTEPGQEEATTNFARAIAQHGKVVLAATRVIQVRPQVFKEECILPVEPLLNAAADWGIAQVMTESGIVRQYYQETHIGSSLPEAAARLAGKPSRPPTEDSASPLWLNYYRPPLGLPHFSYVAVTNQPPGFFRGKHVFIGAQPNTQRPGIEADKFATPFTRWTDRYSPGVEITATAFLNYLRNDNLRRLTLAAEAWIIVASGVLLGGVLGLVRPVAATGFGIVASLGVAGIAFGLARSHLWFAWPVIVFVQVPAALAWSWVCHFYRLNFEKEVLETSLIATRQTPASSATSAGTGFLIPDHELVRKIGQGAYGQVWLARNAVGVFHAVKVVQRRAFPGDDPYEREFRGIQKFMPISRSHPGLVHVLHVGRNDHQGFFFYIMEAGDDETMGQKIDPERYTPKTLASVLARRGMLDPKEGLSLGISLATALAYLHQQQLVHRDIKPANIIYVRDAPKFADVGLVTDMAGPGQTVSCLGTERYMPPEGPGTPGADVYALGKVLYEACLGRDRRLFPEVPTAVLEQAQDTLLRRLNELICRACETDVRER